MNSSKKALTYALLAIGILAAAMVAYYYVQRHMNGSGADLDVSESTEAPQEEKSEFVGTYSPTDGPLEADGKRISFFTVNRADEGGYLGSAKVNTIGADESFYFNCSDVRIAEKEFFLSCQNESQGTISLNGSWEKADGIQVSAKVLWMRDGNTLLEQPRRLQLVP